MRKKRGGAGPLILALLPILLFFSIALSVVFLVSPSSLLGIGLVGSPTAYRQIVNHYAADIVDSLNQGRTQDADSTYQQAVGNLRRTGNDSYVDLAKEIVRRGRPADAVRYLTDAGKQSGDDSFSWDPMLWQTLSDAQRKANDPEEAKRSEAEAEKRADSVRALVGKKAPDNMAQLTDRIFRLLQVGSYYSDVKDDTPSALALFREAVRIAPASEPLLAGNALNALGYTLADKGTTSDEFDQAAQYTKKALDMLPDLPIVRDSYGWALFKKNDLAGARRVLREAVDASPQEPELHYHLGVVYAQIGLTSDARLEFERALTIDPNLTDAQKAIQRLRLPPGQGVLDHA